MHWGRFTQYLEKYAEPEARELPIDLPWSPSFDLGLTIPLRGEAPEEIQERLMRLENLVASANKTLIVIAVLNATPGSPSEYRGAHEELLARLNAQPKSSKSVFHLQTKSPFLSVLWIDRAVQRPFNPKQGVGLARKIGCDILIRLQAEGLLSTPWLWTTDADAALPMDYFEIAPSSGSAVHFSYRHDCVGFSGSEALRLYEIHLRYYFLGLLWAGSPFAYPTIGSCLALSPIHYADVRGFQDREAGEDFHLLNKLRKTGKVFYRRGQPIVLRGRFSKRVPFGTGQSTISIHNNLSAGKPFTLYAPEAFHFLKRFLSEATAALSQEPSSGRAHFQNFLNTIFAGESKTQEILSKLRVDQIVEEAFSTRKTVEARIRHFHTSFDALKTLRLIHLFDELRPSKTEWKLALKTAPFLQLNNSVESPEQILNQMQHLEEQWLGSSFLDCASF